ncbi:hypothetical protein [Streptomyces sp. SYP-A7185]|uniref:hypothetical protein n=1 Tax=Streptomyces sp. SYP-A7185 TaxID=3040076 RepID=UPI0038F79FAD
MPGVRGAGPVALVAVLAAVLSGCGSVQERADAASAAALGFRETLRTTHGARGCAALAPGTREELEQNAELPCARALSDAGLPAADTADAVRVVDVYGRQARVVTDHDTLFLSSFPGGWKITATGCTERPDLPYQCLIKGG